jgi:hypothetical protein
VVEDFLEEVLILVVGEDYQLVMAQTLLVEEVTEPALIPEEANLRLLQSQ